MGHLAPKTYNKETGKPPEELVEWEGIGRETQEEQNAELLLGLLSGKWNHPDVWWCGKLVQIKTTHKKNCVLKREKTACKGFW